KPRLVQVKHKSTHTDSVTALFLKPLTPAELDAVRGVPMHGGKRTAIRHAARVNQPCLVTCVTQQGPWWSAVRNVSSRGLGLIVTRSFPLGALLTIALPLPGKKKLVVLRVVSVRPQEGKRWLRLGGAFLQRLSPEEVQALV